MRKIYPLPCCANAVRLCRFLWKASNHLDTHSANARSPCGRKIPFVFAAFVFRNLSWTCKLLATANSAANVLGISGVHLGSLAVECVKQQATCHISLPTHAMRPNVSLPCHSVCIYLYPVLEHYSVAQFKSGVFTPKCNKLIQSLLRVDIGCKTST